MQNMHTEDVAASKTVLYSPAAQAIQSEDPGRLLYAPNAHVVHANDELAPDRLL